MTKAAKGVKLQKAIEAIEAAIKEEKDKVRIVTLPLSLPVSVL